MCYLHVRRGPALAPALALFPGRSDCKQCSDNFVEGVSHEARLEQTLTETFAARGAQSSMQFAYGYTLRVRETLEKPGDVVSWEEFAESIACA